MAANRTLLYGVGINDAPYVVQRQGKILTEKGVMKRTTVWQCPFYLKWKNMLQRCYYEKNSNTFAYEGCTVCDEWLYFTNFKGWLESQNWEGMDLDKDLLKPGNKIYSPDTCCLVPPELNCALVFSKQRRSENPIGVSKHYSKYTTSISIAGKRHYVGSYNTPEDAHKAWQEQKIRRLNELLGQYTMIGRYDTRVAEAVTKVIWDLQLDISLGRETLDFK